MSKNDAKKGIFEPPSGCRRMNFGISAALSAVSAVLAGAFPSDYGGIMFLTVAVGLFAYVLLASFSFLYIGMGAVISVAVAMLCGVKFPLALASLVFIPLALAISECVRRRAGLSGTVAVTTITAIGILAVFSGICLLFAREDFVTAVKGLGDQYFSMTEASLRQLNNTPAGTVISDTAISTMLDTVKLTMPSMIVLLLMGMSYLAAKIFRLATIVSDSSEMFFGGGWPITASLAGSVVFIACYILTMFAVNADVLYYSAVNILYIILPAQAIVGFRLMFGRYSVLRRQTSFLRGALVILSIYLALSNPVMLFMLAATFTSFYNIRLWLIKRKKDKKTED